MSAEQKYDPATCVTAGELRAMGAALPESIPDCGWVPQASIRYVVADVLPENTPESLAEGKFSVKIVAEFTQPFRWLSCTFVVDGETDGGAA